MKLFVSFVNIHVAIHSRYHLAKYLGALHLENQILWSHLPAALPFLTTRGNTKMDMSISAAAKTATLA